MPMTYDDYLRATNPTTEAWWNQPVDWDSWYSQFVSPTTPDWRSKMYQYDPGLLKLKLEADLRDFGSVAPSQAMARNLEGARYFDAGWLNERDYPKPTNIPFSEWSQAAASTVPQELTESAMSWTGDEMGKQALASWYPLPTGYEWVRSNATADPRDLSAWSVQSPYSQGVPLSGLWSTMASMPSMLGGVAPATQVGYSPLESETPMAGAFAPGAWTAGVPYPVVM